MKKVTKLYIFVIKSQKTVNFCYKKSQSIEKKP